MYEWYWQLAASISTTEEFTLTETFNMSEDADDWLLSDWLDSGLKHAVEEVLPGPQIVIATYDTTPQTFNMVAR